MPVPIWKDCPKMDEIINLEDAKELLKASSKIQKFIKKQMRRKPTYFSMWVIDSLLFFFLS